MHTDITNQKIITDVPAAVWALRNHKIPTEHWNGGASNTLETFKMSLVENDMWLEEKNLNGFPQLSLHMIVAVLHVQVFVGNKWQILYEHSIYCPHTGEEKIRYTAFNGSIGGKKHRGELIQHTAERELAEELEQTEPGFKDPLNYDLVPRFAEIVHGKQDYYPGLPEVFHRYHFLCVIHPKLYWPVYTEYNINTSRIATFKWKDIEDQENPEILTPSIGSILIPHSAT